MSQEYNSYSDIVNSLRNHSQKRVETEKPKKTENLDEGVYKLEDVEKELFNDTKTLESCLSGIEQFVTTKDNIEDVVIAPNAESGITIIGLSDGLASDSEVRIESPTKPSMKRLFRLVYPLFFVNGVITGNESWSLYIQELIQGGKLLPIEDLDKDTYDTVFPSEDSVFMSTLYTEDLKLLDKKVLDTQIDTLLGNYNESNKQQVQKELEERASLLKRVDKDYVFYLPLTGQVVGSSRG